MVTVGSTKVKMFLMACLMQDQKEPWELKFYASCRNWNSVKGLTENVVFIMLGSVYSQKSILETLNRLYSHSDQ